MHHPMDQRFSGSGPRRNLFDSGSYESTRMDLGLGKLHIWKAWYTKYLKVSDFGLKPVQAVGSDEKI
jgi:hypothetical protein